MEQNSVRDRLAHYGIEWCKEWNTILWNRIYHGTKWDSKEQTSIMWNRTYTIG